MVPVWSGLLACSGPPDHTAPAEPPQQGVVLAIRAPDGSLLRDGQGYLASGVPADPDSGGFAYYFDLAPGRTPVSFELEGSAIAFAAPEVPVGGLAAASLVPHPLEIVGVGDPHSDFDLQGGGFTVHIPADSIGRDGVALDVPWTLGYHRVHADDRFGLPADLQVERNDVDVSPFVIDELVALRGTIDSYTDVSALPDQKLDVVMTIPDGSPLLDPSSEPGIYAWSASRGYWSYGGKPAVDPIGHTATFQVGQLGWIALGREPDRSCAQGVVVDGGGHRLSGVEVRLTQQGTLGIDRTTTVDGAFCLPIDPGAPAELAALGFAADRSAMYTWSGSTTGGSVGTCGSAACVDLGVVTVQTWPDSDGDGSWGGPGGDCDDGDPRVSPNPASGDGSYCGSSL